MEKVKLVAKVYLTHGGEFLKPGDIFEIDISTADLLVKADEAELKEIPLDPNEKIKKDLDTKYNREKLAEAAKIAGVDFDPKAKKAEIIEAIFVQGKAEELLKTE